MKTVIIASVGVRYCQTVRVSKIAKTLQKSGYKVKYFGWDRTGENDRKEFELDGIDHEIILRGGGHANIGLLLWYPIWMFLLFWRVATQRACIVYASNFDAAFPCVLAKVFRHHRVLYDIRDSFYMRYDVFPLLKLALKCADRWVMKNASAILYVDENRLTEFEKPFLTKMYLVQNCPEDVPTKIDFKVERPFTVLCSGYLKRDRGVDLLVNAIHRFPGARLLVAGEIVDANLSDVLLSDPQIDYRGWLPPNDAIQLCYESDVVTALYDPSKEIYRRAASNKWYDAMMSQRPLLTNVECMNSKLVDEEQIGYLVPYGNVDAIAEVFRIICANPEQALERGKNGRRLFESKYNWGIMEKRLLAAFGGVGFCEEAIRE